MPSMCSDVTVHECGAGECEGMVRVRATEGVRKEGQWGLNEGKKKLPWSLALPQDCRVSEFLECLHI